MVYIYISLSPSTYLPTLLALLSHSLSYCRIKNSGIYIYIYISLSINLPSNLACPLQPLTFLLPDLKQWYIYLSLSINLPSNLAYPLQPLTFLLPDLKQWYIYLSLSPSTYLPTLLALLSHSLSYCCKFFCKIPHTKR